ncbi:hypothetical protein BASA81_009490 [Batrachochytrium salamandrivorans]|nr:hypothetical protein BASA81_009490 [Batrachochytrium salamandrivorans]
MFQGTVIRVFTVPQGQKIFQFRRGTRSPLVSAAGAVGFYFMPDMITDIWEPTRDFAFAKLPTTSKSVQNLCSLSSSSGMPQLSVVTANGSFYVFTILEQGGECTLVKQHSIMDSDEEN